MEVFLGLGSNIEPREEHLTHALDEIRGLGRVLGESSVYETDPVGFTDQPPFLNMVVQLETSLPVEALLERLQAIELERGRKRPFRNAPRTLDIDILLYGDRSRRTPTLTVPHPGLAHRPFVLVPLLELAPDLTDPTTGELYSSFLPEATPGVRRLNDTPRDAENE